MGFVKTDVLFQILVTLVARVSKKRILECFQHVVGRIETTRRRKADPTNLEAGSGGRVKANAVQVSFENRKCGEVTYVISALLLPIRLFGPIIINLFN